MTTPTWSSTAPIDGPPQAGLVNIGLQCQNMPVGSQIRFTLAEADGVPALDSGWVTITNPNLCFMVQQTWPAGYQNTMTFEWAQAGESPQPGATLVPVVFLPSPEEILGGEPQPVA